jgi:hypothetical protein
MHSTSKNISLGLDSQFDLFTHNKITSAIKCNFFEEISPITALQSGAPIEFSISGAGNLFRDLSKSYMTVRVKITKSDGSAISDANKVGIINCGLHSLFSNVDIALNGQKISDGNGFYPFRAYLDTLLNYNEALQRNQGELIAWCKDAKDQWTDFDASPVIIPG